MARNRLELHSAYYPDRLAVDQEAGDEPSKTRQEFAAECDINGIMARYEKTGMIPTPAGLGPPRYLDLTLAPGDLMSAMATYLDAEDAFMSLPAVVRRDFDNDPMKFVEFAADPENIDKMREYGLAPPAPAEEPAPLGSAANPISIVPADQAGTLAPEPKASGKTTQ